MSIVKAEPWDPIPSTSLQNSDSDSNSGDYDEEDDEDEDETPKRTEKPAKRASVGRRHMSKLDPNLKGLMGEANLRYARGDIETATKMCFEVMRRVPEAYEPYLTLAQIFENTDITKYEGYLTIASALYPHDSSIWCRLAELYVQNDKIRDAISAYTKALKANPKNVNLHQRRLQLVEQMGDSKFALTCKKQMANNLPRNMYLKIIDLTKEVTKQYHEEKKWFKALSALEVPFKRIPKRITQDLVNMMLELLLLTVRFPECLDIFIQYCNFTFEITVDVDNKIVINSYVMPENTPIDLKVKFIICLIKLRSFHLVPSLIDSLIMEESVETIGDLYLDVAEELMIAEQPQEAIKLLVPLVKSETYDLAAVWLKYAECLYGCDMLTQAVEAYFTVMTKAPQHVEVLYPLAMTLLKLDKKTEALEVLSQDLSANKIDVAVLIERMKLLKQIGDFEEYWNCAELLLSRHCVVLRYPEEMRLVLPRNHKRAERNKKFKQLRRFRKDNTPVESTIESIREPSMEHEYVVFRDILKFALERREYAQLEKIAFMALSSKRFVEKRKDILVAAYYACMLNNDTFHGYSIIRSVVLNDPLNNLAWNLFNILLQRADDTRHNRFISRFQERLPDSNALQIIVANYCLSVNNFHSAMKFYMHEFRKNRSPYLSFILGVIMLEGCKKRSVGEDKVKLVEIASFLFLYYAKNRSKEAQHEVYYNLGRMYHQVGIMYLAEHYYLKVLELEDVENSDLLGLKQEAAFNLHLIYKNSGNLISARNVLLKHIVI